MGAHPTSFLVIFCFSFKDHRPRRSTSYASFETFRIRGREYYIFRINDDQAEFKKDRCEEEVCLRTHFGLMLFLVCLVDANFSFAFSLATPPSFSILSTRIVRI